MKAFEILKTLIDIIQKNLKIAIYNTFSCSNIKLPIHEKFLTIDIFSGSQDKTQIDITIYSPKAQGADSCRDITKKTINILNSAKIENLSEVSMQKVNFDNNKKAYVQQCKLTFKVSKQKLIPIYFGDQKIVANEDVCLKFARNISIYYSQISGVQFKDLGPTLKKVTGTAPAYQTQVNLLWKLIKTAAVDVIKIQDHSFKATLTCIELKPEEKIFFTFLEVKNSKTSSL